LFPVGRLDRSSEGLILVTNDGELANQLTHPRYSVEKTYAVRVAGNMTSETMQKLRKGVHLAEGPARVSSIRVKQRHKQSTDLEIVLREGRNREIRRVLARVGHKVMKLTRIAMGTLRLGELPTGAYRTLSSQEIRALRECARSKPQGESSSAAPGSGSRGRLKKPKPAAKPRPTAKPKRPKPATGRGSVLGYDEDS
jgi:23S rRNA pseudouridine2605 synthase